MDTNLFSLQVTSLGGQAIFQPVVGKQAGQYLIVNPALHTSGGRIQIVTQDRQETQETSLDAVRRREILARQPSYCKILNDLKEAESSESEDCPEQTETTKKEEGADLVLKGEAIEVVDGGQTVKEKTHTFCTALKICYFIDTNSCHQWPAVSDCLARLHGGTYGWWRNSKSTSSVDGSVLRPA